MFYIRKNSIKYLETSRGVAHTASLHEMGTDKMVGIVENTGCGGATTFSATDQRAHELVAAFVKTCNVQHEENILDTYMDLAEGVEPLYPELAAKLSSN